MFTRGWTAPWIALKSSAGEPALLNIEYFFADADVAVDDLLIGLPVLYHLSADTLTLLEDLRDLFDETDCPSVTTNSQWRRVRRLMISWLNWDPSQNKISYEGTAENHEAKEAVLGTWDTKPGYQEIRRERNYVHVHQIPTHWTPIRGKGIDSGIFEILKKGFDNGLPDINKNKLRHLVTINVDISRPLFFSVPSATFESLRIKVSSEARWARARLQIQPQKQRQFSSCFIRSLMTTGMA